MTFLHIQSVLIFAYLFLWTQQSFGQPGADTLYRQNRNYTIQTELYNIYRTTNADIVMLGNSITFGVNWNELMGRTTIVNRGIGSDNTYGFLQRMEYVYAVRPRVCCVMGGINDIYQGIPVDTIFQNYTKIIEGLRRHSIIPVIQSTLLVSPKWKNSEEKNREVQKLDSLLYAYARNNTLDFINLNDVMSDGRMLMDEMTTDGVHLTAKGYAAWRSKLDVIFRRYGL